MSKAQCAVARAVPSALGLGLGRSAEDILLRQGSGGPVGHYSTSFVTRNS